MERSLLNKIKSLIEEFFEKTTFEVEVGSIKEERGTVFVELKTDSPQILIGESGQTLSEIQHLLKAILRRQISDQFFLNIHHSVENIRIQYVEFK